MIATDVGGERYRLVFEHIDEDVPWDPVGRETDARLERRNGDGWIIVQAGRAKCSLGDPYVKETGRRIALRRLFRKACPPSQRAGTSHESTNAKAMRRLYRAYYDRPRGQVMLDEALDDLRKRYGSATNESDSDLMASVRRVLELTGRKPCGA